MNKRPIYYSQHDPRWGGKPYQVPGERDTIGKSGCGPSCAAMLISTLTGKKFTPEEACRWSVEHGYKALNQGTYYSYFTPQFAFFGLKCRMLNWQKTYGKPDHPNHEKALKELKKGNYIIALMKRGNWTTGGHFVVVWWQDGKVRINDPNSTRPDRTNGDITTFRSQVQYYWIVEAEQHNREDEDMISAQQFKELFDSMRKDLQDNDCGEWSAQARKWAVEGGLISGGDPGPDGQPNYMWQDMLTREQAIMLFYRFAQLMGKA